MTYEVPEFTRKMADYAFEEVKQYNPRSADDFTLSLISIILLSVCREYEQLKLGYEKNTVLEAWACRNLLELCVFTKWALRSADNGKRFTADITIDGIELFESVKKWMEHQDPGIPLPEIEETLRIARARSKSEGTEGERHLEVRGLAEEVGMLEDFNHAMKLCSKLVHVTAWSVFHRDNEDGEYSAFRVILFNSGARYGLEAFGAIKEFLN